MAMPGWRRRNVVSRPALALGTLLGAAVAALLMPSPVAPREQGLPRISGRLLDEAAGSLAEVTFHYVPRTAFITDPIYGAWLSTLDSRTRLRAVVPPPTDGLDPAAELRAFLRRLPAGESLIARTRIITASAPISPWSKDRALVATSAQTELLLPAEPSGPGALRRADWMTPFDLARALPSELHATVLPLDFDAGDFAVTGKRLLVDANLLAKNLGRGIDSPEQLARVLAQAFAMEVTVLGRQPGDVPRHHLSMYLTPLIDGIVLVGDPQAGRRLVGEPFRPGERNPDTGEELTADFSAATQARHDRAAAELGRAGFRVVRIPTVPFDDKTYFAYTNGVFETRGGRRIAWVPVFDVPRLDRAALAVYAELGWETRPVPSRAAYPYHGTLGCLVNVLARDML
jgi:hypothetical protein